MTFSKNTDILQLYIDERVSLLVNLQYLKYFREVCNEGSITKASKKLHVTQPAVTNAIKELETLFDIQLFYRTNNKIITTAEGKKFLLLVNDLLDQMENFRASASELSSNENCILRVGIPSILGVLLFSKITPHFQKLHPNIELQFTEIATLSGISMLNDASLDLMIGVEDHSIKQDCKSLILHETQLMFITNKDNPLWSEETIYKNMLKNLPFVTLSKGSYHYDMVIDHYCANEYQPNIVMCSNQISTLRYLLNQNLASTISYRELFCNDPDLIHIPLAEPIPATISIMWNKNAYITHAMNTFINFMKQIDYSTL